MRKLGSKEKLEENFFSKSEVQKKIVRNSVQEVSRYLYWLDHELWLSWRPIEEAILEELTRKKPREEVGVVNIIKSILGVPINE